MFLRYAAVCAFLVLTAGVSPAQSSESGDNWLMQNYRFAGPPAPGELRPTDPVVSELQEIQNTTLAILRKANFAGDFEAALAAAAQATANIQLRGTINQRLQSPEHKTAAEPAPSKPRVYLIALKDGAIQVATSHWEDARMLHYITPEGSHEQVRLDLVDRPVSTEINRRSNLQQTAAR
jgi:hypothetical protein